MKISEFHRSLLTHFLEPPEYQTLVQAKTKTSAHFAASLKIRESKKN
jgi:hypothetical protein